MSTEAIWEPPAIEDGPESSDHLSVIAGLRALHEAQRALERATTSLEEASACFADADLADVDGLLAASRVALHSAVNRRVSAAIFLLRDEAQRAPRTTV